MPLSPERASLPGSIVPRVIGWWMCLIALLGPVVVGTASGAGAAAAVTLFWTAPALWWASRLIRFGVTLDPAVLVVHNLLRTYRVGYGEITDVRLHSRQQSSRWPLKASQLFSRRVVVVDVVGRERPIELDSTESLWWPAGLLTHRPAGPASDADLIRSVWLDRRPATQ